MGMRNVGAWAAVLFVLASVATAADAPADKGRCAELLANVPDDATVVVVARSISEAQEQVKSFLDLIDPGLYNNMGDPTKYFVNDTGDGGGLNADGAMGTMALPGAEDEETWVVLLPVTSFDAWKKGWSESLGKEEGSPYEYFETHLGTRSYFVSRGGYVLLSETAAGLDAWTKAMAKPLAADRRAGLENALSSAPLAAGLSLATLRRTDPDALDELSGQIGDAQLPGMPWASNILKVYQTIAEDIFTGVDEIAVSASPSDQGLLVKATATAAKGTVIYDMVGEQAPVDLSDMSLLPAGTSLVFAGGFRGDATWKYFARMYGDILAAMAENAEEAATLRSDAAKLIEDVRAAGLGECFAGGLFWGDRESPFVTAGVYRTGDARKALDVLIAMVKDPRMSAMTAKLGAVQGAKYGEPTVSTEAVAGTTVTLITQPIDMSGVDPMQQGMFEQMFGKAIETRLAAGDKRLYLTVGKGSKTMERLLSSTDRLDKAKVRKSLASMGTGSSAAMLLSVPDYFAQVFSMSAMFAPGAPAISLVAPATTQYAGAAVSFGQGKVSVVLNVPAEQITATKDMFQQMQQQMMERGMTPAEPGTEPEPGPPAD